MRLILLLERPVSSAMSRTDMLSRVSSATPSASTQVADVPGGHAVADLHPRFKGRGVLAENAARLGEMDLEAGALLELVILAALELDDGVEHVFPLRRAARLAIAPGMFRGQHAHAVAAQLEQPGLHRVPGLRVVLASAGNQRRAVVQDQELGVAEQRCDALLAFLRREIEGDADLLFVDGAGIGRLVRRGRAADARERNGSTDHLASLGSVDDEAQPVIPIANVGELARSSDAVVIPGPAGERSEAGGDPVHGPARGLDPCRDVADVYCDAATSA